MLIDQGSFETKAGFRELNDTEISAISGGIVPAYIGVRIGFAVGTIVVLAAIDYFSE